MWNQLTCDGCREQINDGNEEPDVSPDVYTSFSPATPDNNLDYCSTCYTSLPEKEKCKLTQMSCYWRCAQTNVYGRKNGSYDDGVQTGVAQPPQQVIVPMKPVDGDENVQPVYRELMLFEENRKSYEGNVVLAIEKVKKYIADKMKCTTDQIQIGFSNRSTTLDAWKSCEMNVDRDPPDKLCGCVLIVQMLSENEHLQLFVDFFSDGSVLLL